MPLPLTVSCFRKIQTDFTLLVPAHPGSPGQRAIEQVCACNIEIIRIIHDQIPELAKLGTILLLHVVHCLLSKKAILQSAINPTDVLGNCS